MCNICVDVCTRMHACLYMYMCARADACKHARSFVIVFILFLWNFMGVFIRARVCVVAFDYVFACTCSIVCVWHMLVLSECLCAYVSERIVA